MKTVMITLFVVMIFVFSGLNEALGQWTTSGNDIYNSNTGNVGIGNNSPSTLLYVAKNMTEPTITVRNLGGFGGASYSMIDNTSGADWKFKATNSGGFKIRDNANGLDVIQVEYNSAANALYINSAGYIGMGTNNPQHLLHVAGGDVKIGNVSGDARKLYFGDGSNVYIGEEATDNRLGIFAGSMTMNINSSTGADGQVLTSNGTTCLWEDLPAGSDLSGTGTTDYVARWLSANTLGTGLIRDNASTVGINVAPDPVFRLKVEGGGGVTSIYGRYDDNHYGYLGSFNYGVYGGYNADRYGYLGNSTYGVFGSYDINHYGSIGSNQYGVFGYNSGNTTGNAGVYGTSEASAAGTFGIYGVNYVSNAYGSGYVLSNSCNGVVGYTHYGTGYHFGVFGSRDDDAGGPSAGVIGSVAFNNAGKPWGALGFQDASSNEFAGYFSGNIMLTGGLNDGGGYGSAGSMLLSNGAGDVYWSPGTALSGTGTSGYIPKWTGSASLSNANIYDDGTNIGIGTISPTAKLYVFANTLSTSIYGYYGGSVFGYLGGPGMGAYGQYTASRYGMIGNSNYGAYGQYSSTILGYLGGASYGSYGQYNTSILGFQGSPAYGSYGQYNSSIKGHLGSGSYGAYGQWDPDRLGYLGSTDYGAFGQYNPSIAGYLGSANYGAYGQNSTRAGYLGSTSYGAFGQYDASKYGFLGSTNYGVYGQYDANRYGYLGGSAIGAYGQHSADLFGYMGGTNYGAYGQYDANRHGYFGSTLYGAYGQYNASIKGYIGSSAYGVYGQNGSDILGALGTSSYGVYGYKNTVGAAAAYFYHNGSPATYNKQWAVEAYNNNATTNDGNAYGYTSNNSGGVRACNDYGATYTFGLGGWNYNDDIRTAGVLGAQYNADYWGALGYKDSGGLTYGGYFSNAHGQGGGKMLSGSQASGIGIGAWGGLMGADIHGGVYGMYLEGENYALYAKGPVYTNQPVIQLQQIKGAEKAALYTSTSTDITVMYSGQGELVYGQCQITFDNSFASVISRSSPLIITVTPMGPTNGVYVASSGHNGFVIKENNNGQSNTLFSYIVIAKRDGYENPQLAIEVMASDFETKMTGGLHNDAQTSANGKGIYYQNGQLLQGQAPGSLNRAGR